MAESSTAWLQTMVACGGKRITGNFIEYYNTTRLHSAIGFIAPKDRLEGRQDAIHKARDK